MSTDPPEPSEGQPKRRSRLFSFRALLIALVFVAFVIAYVPGPQNREFLAVLPAVVVYYLTMLLIVLSPLIALGLLAYLAVAFLRWRRSRRRP